MPRKMTGPIEPSHVVPLSSRADLNAKIGLEAVKAVETSDAHVDTAIAPHSRTVAEVLLWKHLTAYAANVE